MLTTAYEHINNNEYTGLLLLDLKKAFDTVAHSILLYKLQHYGIRGVASELLKSFLSNHFRFVSHHNSSSDILINKFGVPQGNNLGPLLFLIYINDIMSALNSNPRLFADNTCLNINAVTPSLLSIKMNQELTTELKWTTANKITVNPEKSHCLTEVESLRTSLASRTYFEVLGLGLEASSPRKLPCSRPEDSTIF